MKLVRIAWITAAGCGLGIVLLFGAAVLTLNRFDANNAEIRKLFVLQERVNHMLEGAATLMMFGAEPSLWRELQEEAQAIRTELELFGIDHTDARKAARHVQGVLDTLRSISLNDIGAGLGGSDHSNGKGPLNISFRGQILLDQILSHGSAARTTLEDAVFDRQRGLTTAQRRQVAGFGVLALILVGFAMAGSHWTYWRLRAPIKELLRTIELVRQGDLNARANIPGSDEFAELGCALNGLVDSRQSAEQALSSRQADLEQRDEMLASSQRIARVGSWRLALDDTALEWSEETYRIVGVSPDSFSPTPSAFFEHVHPEDRERLERIHAEIMTGKREHELEFRIIRPDGHVRHVHERGEIWTDPTLGREVMTGTIQDITERRQAEERQHQYRQLIEGSRDMHAIADTNWRYVMVNRAYAERFGKAPADFEGVFVGDILGHDHFDREVRPQLERVLTGESLIFEIDRRYPEIGVRQLLMRYYPLESPDGTVRHVGAVITDVTELKEASRELYRQRTLLEIAGRIARLGGWSVDLTTAEPTITWSTVVCEIHGMPPGHQPNLEEGISYYAPEWRERIIELFAACVEEGTPYNEELEIINARGERVWVRAAGQPVRNAVGRMVGVEGAFQDISGPKAIEQERTRLAQRMQTILQSVTDAFFNLDHQWRFDYVNAEAERLLRKGRDELIGRVFWEAFPGVVGTRIEQECRRAVSERVSAQLEEYYPPLEKWLDIRAYPSEEGLAVFFRDTTTAREMVERLREQEENLRRSRDNLAEVLATRQALIDSLPAHIALLEYDGTIVDVNDQWRHFGVENDYPDKTYGVGSNYLTICENAFGDCAESARETAAGIREVLNGKRDQHTIEYPCHAPGEERWYRMMATRFAGSEAPSPALGAVVMHVDITERKLAERELNRLAFQDALTGLYSRSGFVQEASGIIRQSGWDEGALVAAVNLSGLHDVNEAHGFEAGDMLLMAVSRRLARFDGDGVVARTGGDEFAAYLPPRGDVADRIAALEALFDEPVQLSEVSARVSPHIGYTVLGPRRREIEELLHEASVALAHNRHATYTRKPTRFTHELDERSRERIQLNRELRQALVRGEFELYFQPQVSLPHGELVSAEALLRWKHPTRGILSPGHFIEIAEQSQLIGPIGDWVVEAACAHLSEWHREGLEAVRVSINVSLVQFMVGDFTKTVQGALSRHHVPPSKLALEITESVFERESDVLRAAIQSLADMGLHISLDDFGTGYSSLLYLKRYPMNEIKIDRGFVWNVIEDPYSQHIVRTVVGLGNALGADVVAEGVETKAVAEALLALGCRLAQGFYFAMPMRAEDFRSLLVQQSRLPVRGTTGSGPA